MRKTNDLGELVQHDYYDLKTDLEVYGKGKNAKIPSDDAVFFNHLAARPRRSRFEGQSC